MVDIIMIICPQDIEWESKKSDFWYNKWERYLESTNLPYWITAFYTTKDKYLSVYTKDSEFMKIKWLSKWEAESYILWMINSIEYIISMFHQEWFIE